MNINLLKEMVKEAKAATRAKKEIQLNEGIYCVYLKEMTIAPDGSLTWSGFVKDACSDDEQQQWQPITHTEERNTHIVKDAMLQAIDFSWYTTVSEDIKANGYENRTKFCSLTAGTETVDGYLLIKVYTTEKDGIVYKNVNYSATKCAQALAEYETINALEEADLIDEDTAPEDLATILDRIKKGNINPEFSKCACFIPHSATPEMQQFYKVAFGTPNAKNRKEVK